MYLSVIINKIKTYFIYLRYKVFNKKIDIDGCPVLLKNTIFDIDNKSTIKIGKKFATRANVLLDCKDGGKLHIGDNVFMNRGVEITCLYDIRIGNRCIFGPGIKMFDHDHSFKAHKVDINKYKFGNIIIGDDCWIGAGCIILRGTQIGQGCIIGAGTIVKGIIPNNSIVKMDRTLQIEQNTAN